MQAKVSLLFPALLVTVVACESSAAQIPAGAATVTQMIPEAAMATALPEAALPSRTDAPEQAPGFDNANLYPGLQVVYIRDGEVWLWADGEGSRQLTTEQGYRNVAVAPDGQHIAFSRGNEIWVMAIDGTGERQLLSQAYLDGISANSGRRTLLDSFGWVPGGNLIFFSTFQDEAEYPIPNYDLHLVEIGNPAPYQWLGAGQGGRLSFSPDGEYLAISSLEWVDILDLGSGFRLRALEYPGIANYETGFLPEMIWNPDSSGFKTVIPPAAKNGTNQGPAEFYFVFPSGTVASLASFELAPLYLAIPHLSPDGAYVLFAVSEAHDKLALYLMDSSGARRPYSESAERVVIYGWAVDSKQFIYGLGQPVQSYLGSVSAGPIAIGLSDPQNLKWFDSGYGLAIVERVMVFFGMNDTIVKLDSPVSQFDIFP